MIPTKTRSDGECDGVPDLVVLSEELYDAMFALRRSSRRSVTQRSGMTPLTSSQVELLRLLGQRPGISVAQTARELHLAPNSVSTLVRHLVQLGFVRRDIDETDRRVARLAVTRIGQDRLSMWKSIRGEVVSDAMAVLSDHEIAWIAAAVPVLEHLADLLQH